MWILIYLGVGFAVLLKRWNDIHNDAVTVGMLDYVSKPVMITIIIVMNILFWLPVLLLMIWVWFRDRKHGVK